MLKSLSFLILVFDIPPKATTFFVVNLEINYPQYPNWQAMSVIGVGRVLLEQKKNDQAVERFKEVLVKYDDKEALNIAQKYLDQLDSN